METVQRVVGDGQVVAGVYARQEVLPQGEFLRTIMADEAFREGGGLVCKKTETFISRKRGIRMI